MKKCASCSKDLPEAALHCVFCGAKQAPAPAVQPGLAKTAFGYSANEVMQQLGNPSFQPQAQQPYQPPRPQTPSQPPPSHAPVPAANAATVMLPPGSGPGANFNPQAAYGAPAPAPAPPYGGAPAAGYGAPAPQYGGAPAPGYGAPAPQYGGAPSPGYGAPSPMGTGPMGGGMGIHSPPQPTPQPLPTAPPPYLASQTAARAGHPIEPWKDSLKLMMFVWGAIALVTFATPLSADPLGFNWDLILDAPGKLKIIPLIWAAAGLLSIVCAALPMESLPRGIVAAVLGLAGALVPLFVLGDMPPWQLLLPMLGSLVLIPGLLIRDEYTDSIVPRVMVTIGVVCTVVPFIAPVGGQIPLVLFFKAIVDGAAKGELIIVLVKFVVVLTTLLVWMPGPQTAGAKIFAWVLIIFPIAEFAIAAIGAGHIGDVASKQPGALVAWAPGVVYSVLVGYGLATVVGKQLE